MINISYISDDECTVSEDVWQYDYGQQVTITGLPSLPSSDTTQVHFSNQKVAGAAYAVEAAVQGGAVIADVPDLVLMDGAGSGAVWCFVFVCDADDGETVYRVHFPVIRRPKPNIYNEDKVYEHMFARTIAKVTAAASEASEAVEEAQEVLESIPSDYTELSRRVLALYPTETASGSVVAFDDGADDIPVKSLSVSIMPKQSGSGDPSPSNIRPISGWDAVNVYRGVSQSDYDTYPISLTSAGTVYGGTLDVTTGELTVDRAIVTINGTDSSGWWTSSGSNYSQFMKTFHDAVNSMDAITNRLEKISLADRGTKSGLVSYDNDNTFRFVLASSYGVTTVSDWMTWLASNQLQVCYVLATPTTYHLTPTEITTLLGNNTVWSDAGDISVTYRADLQKYFEA